MLAYKWAAHVYDEGQKRENPGNMASGASEREYVLENGAVEQEGVGPKENLTEKVSKQKIINMDPDDKDEGSRVREIDTIENYMFRKKATYERAMTEPSISVVDERQSQEEDGQSFKSFLEQ